MGQKYLDIIKDKYGLSSDKILHIISPLQQIGNPRLIKLNGLPVRVSTTALRYLKVALDIKNQISIDKPIDIVEIGCGYGGQAVIINRVLEINSYTFLDLWQVNYLIRRFVEDSCFDTNYIISTINELNNQLSNWDLVISNYAFSELSMTLQKRYLDKVILKSTHGYITMNSGKKGICAGMQNHSQDQLLNLIKNSRIFSEVPNTSINNYLLTW